MAQVRSIDALKEWAVAVQALLDGRQTILLRKGGIHEPHGAFQPAHRQFFLLPGREHQRQDLLKPAAQSAYASLLDAGPDPAPALRATGWAELHTAVPVDDPRQALALDGEHIWAEAYVRQRLAYKPELPLHVLVLRVYSLAAPAAAPWNERYAGCRSWVKLDAPLLAEAVAPALDEAAFETALERLRRVGCRG